MLEQLATAARPEKRVNITAAPQDCLKLSEESLGSKPYIDNYLAQRRETFWNEYSSAGRKQKFSLGRAIADVETLKHSGAGQLLEIIESSCTKFGQASLFTTTNMPRDPKIKTLRREALKELSDSPQIRKFISQVISDMKLFTNQFRHAMLSSDFVNQNVILKLARSTIRLQATLDSAPPIEAALLKAIVEQMSKDLNCEFFDALKNIEKQDLNRFIKMKDERTRIVHASVHEDKIIGAIAAIAVPLSLLAGVIYGSNVTGGGPATLLTTAASMLAAAAASFYAFKFAAPKAGKFGQTFINAADENARQSLCAAAGLLDELRVLSELKVMFPAVTSYSKPTNAKVISIDQMRHPLACLQVGDSVPSNFRLAAGEPLLAGGQNGGGKTFFDQAIIQNYVMDEIDAVVFGLNASMPEINGATMHVPEQSHGSDSGKGRCETEGARLREQAIVSESIQIINMDEPGGGTSREESRDVILPALGELSANNVFVVVICHDYAAIPALVNAGLAKAVMPRLNENGEPTFEIVSEIPTSSGGSKVLEMTSLSSVEAIKRLRAVGGDEELYWRFQRLHE